MITTATKISQNDIFVDNQELDFISKCIEKRWLSEGEFVKKLSETLGFIINSNFVTFAPNGTLGLFLGLLALDLPKDSEIIIPSFTFYASATAAIFAGLKPVFIDVNPATFNLIPEKVESAITSRTSAIMPVHIFGQCCDIVQVCEIAKKYNLKVIEDAAQAFGVKYKGKQVGTFGDVGVFSFFSDKIITMGEGAAIIAKDKSLYDKIRLLRNQGRENSGTFIHPELGMNFRITDIQAAIGLSQIKKFKEIVKERLEKWELYTSLLTKNRELKLMEIAGFSNLIPFRFCIKTKKKKELIDFLEKEGISTRSFFFPMHKQPKLEKYLSNNNCQNSEDLYEQGICLPIHHHISHIEIKYICAKINFFLSA